MFQALFFMPLESAGRFWGGRAEGAEIHYIKSVGQKRRFLITEAYCEG